MRISPVPDDILGLLGHETPYLAQPVSVGPVLGVRVPGDH